MQAGPTFSFPNAIVRRKTRAPFLPRVNRPLPLLLGALAVLAAAGSATIAFRTARTNRLLRTDLAAASTHTVALESQLASARSDLAARDVQLDSLDADLGNAKTRLTAAEVRNTQLARQLAQAEAQLAERDAFAQTLQSRLHDFERDQAGYQRTIADLERQLAEAQQGAAASSAEFAAHAVFSTRRSAATFASVLSIGPQSAFVVLDYGSDRGAAPGQALSIRRGSDTLAQVHLGQIRPHLSVAHVVPDSLRAALQKGDSAVLTD